MRASATCSAKYLFTSRFKIFHEPLACLHYTFTQICEGVIWQVGAKLGVTCGLFVLAVGLRGVKHNVAFEFHALSHHPGHISDRNFCSFIHGKDYGVCLLVGPHGPHGQLRQVYGVDELSQGLPTAPDGEVGVVTLCNVALVHQTRNDMSVLNAEVVMGPENVGGDDRREIAAIFIFVAPVEDVDHALGVCVALVGGVGWS
mmetsp:Transcript_22084/g.32060  ORF Transcript_22084/g.32060 Transcript_22084/m.32060 type:complete len:201 (+) Transcript_22084:182-784(+)